MIVRFKETLRKVDNENKCIFCHKIPIVLFRWLKYFSPMFSIHSFNYPFARLLICSTCYTKFAKYKDRDKRVAKLLIEYLSLFGHDKEEIKKYLYKEYDS